MENAADALKIAFVMFIFAIAITTTFSLISQAKSTADTVLYQSDETNFYEHTETSDLGNREVSVTEIIPMLYRYYEESIGVTIKLKNGETYTFDLKNNESILLEDKVKLTSEADREANLAKFIQEKLPKNAKFKEEFVEIPISGVYEYGSDGAELVLTSGGKKIYITYTEK